MRKSLDEWVTTLGKLAGLLCILEGLVEYAVVGNAEPAVFATGGLLLAGSAGRELVGTLRTPPPPPRDPGDPE